jgi:hypothetical protein
MLGIVIHMRLSLSLLAAPSAPALDFEALNRRFTDLKTKHP